MKKIFLFFVFAGIALGLFFGIKSELKSKSDDDEHMIETSGDIYIHELNIPIMEVDSLNPLLTYNKQVLNVLNLIYESLVTIGNDESLKPILATEWVEKDNNNWIIKLRKGVRWHNGNDFTASDVIFTINQLISGDINSPYKDNVSNIASVDKLDDYSINITLKERDEVFIYKLLFPIIPEYYFKNGDILNDYKNNMPIGTGPYKYISTNNVDNIIELSRNNAWWNTDTNAKLDKIHLYKYTTYGEAIKAYKSSNVDIIITSMSDWEKKFGTIGNNVYSYESSVFDTIIPNTKKTALADGSVRKAILYGINRENITSKVFNSNATITDLPIHTRSRNYLSSVQTSYNFDKAKQVLINAGWQNDSGAWIKNDSGSSLKLKFTLLINEENDEHVKAADIIKDNLNDLGIEIILKKVKWLEYKSLINSDNFELALASLDIKNEFSILDMLKTDGNLNYANYSSSKMDDLILKVKKNYNTDIIKELEKLYKDETPYIGLYFRNNAILTNKSVKGSIEPIWNNPYVNIISWCK